MSPPSICSYKTRRMKTTNRAVATMGRPMMLRSGLFACLFLSGIFSPQLAVAIDDYPKRQIKIIVPFPAGAGPDQVARMLGQHLQGAFGQTVVIENRTGALGSIGALEVARSTPDGYTLLMGTNTTQAANVAMLKNLPYDPGKDFAPIIRTITTAMVLVVKPDFPAKNLAQFMEYARARPNLTAGYGSGASQISIGQLQTRGGMSVVAASYRGVPQAVTDVIAGVIDLAFADFSIAIPQMQGGTLRGIGVTSPKRNSLTPDLPALAEAMPGFEATIWYGLLAPAGTSETIVNKLYDESEKFLNTPGTREKLATVGVIVSPMRPAEFGAFISSEITRWTADAKAAGIEAK
jgi:tripartite-type tricarboxylate transporter receptor subunit TctC